MTTRALCHLIAIVSHDQGIRNSTLMSEISEILYVYFILYPNL